MNKKILLILVFFAVFNLIRSIPLFRFDLITGKFDLKKYEKRYNDSQWVNPISQKPVGDDVVYAYAGAKYMLGENPILVNSEHPPLGKNLIGLSALYLKNEYVFSVLSGLFAIITFYFLARQVLKNTLISIALSLTLSLEPLFVSNYFLTLLDLVTLGFMNLYFYFILQYQSQKKIKAIYLAGIFLGLIASTKFFGLIAPVIAATGLFFLIKKDWKAMVHYLFGLGLSVLVLVINYFQFFAHGNSLMDFLKLQKYIYTFHTLGRREMTFLNGSLFSLIFTGNFFVGVGKMAREAHFSIIWPISFVAALVNSLTKRFNSPLMIWVAVYCASMIMSFPNARYLILLLPYLYIISVDILKKRNEKLG